ncbi:MAG: hypothetical protein ACPH4G_08685 [Henriciella sp.]
MTKRASPLAKSLTILTITLLIGALAGAAITGALVRSRLDNARAFSTNDGFTRQFIELLEPLSNEQRSVIKPIITRSGQEMQDVMSVTRLEFFRIVEALESDLEPHLTEKQRIRLEARRREMRERLDRTRDD